MCVCVFSCVYVCPLNHHPSHLPWQVYEAVKVLSVWEQDVAQLRSQYEQLLFFTIPKLLHLYHMITALEPDLESIVQEVRFLFQNTPPVRKKLKETIEVRTEHA